MTKFIIFGAGGHSISVSNVIKDCSFSIESYVEESRTYKFIQSYSVISFQELMPKLKDNNYFFTISVGDNSLRYSLYENILNQFGILNFPPLIHPSAAISSTATIGEGSVIMPNVTVGPNVSIGRFCILNTASSIDHDSVMKDFSSISPGVITGGSVVIGYRTAISIGSTLKHAISIGDDSVIGAHSYVNKDLPSNVLAYSVPVKIVKARTFGDTYLD